MKTGEKIETQRRKAPGVSQEKLAEKMGITPQAYRNKITGKSFFKMKVVEAAAEALQVSVEQLAEDRPVIVNNSFHHQKGNGIVVQQGLADHERAMYERMLQEKDEQILFLRSLLKGEARA